MAIATISPVTGETLRSFDELTSEELNLEHEADSVSALITSEMGQDPARGPRRSGQMRERQDRVDR
jgi:hypothetical protein